MQCAGPSSGDFRRSACLTASSRLDVNKYVTYELVLTTDHIISDSPCAHIYYGIEITPVISFHNRFIIMLQRDP